MSYFRKLIRHLTTATALMLSLPSFAQCPPGWLPGVAAPNFTVVASETPVINASIRMSNGDMIFGGHFTAVDGIATNHIIRWTGNQWLPVGSGVLGSNASINDFAILPNGDLIAVGNFISAGGTSAGSIARWNGSVWSPMGTTPSSSGLTSIAVLSNGDILVGGSFTSFGGISTNSIARWNGTQWSGFSENLNHLCIVFDILALPDETFVICGTGLTGAGGSSTVNITKWNGATWTRMGGQLGSASSRVYSLAQLPDGRIVAGGNFTTNVDGTPLRGIGVWDEFDWLNLGSGVSSEVRSLAIAPNGDLYAGGLFTSASGIPSRYVAKWNGQAWTGFGNALEGGVLTISFGAQGEVYCAGNRAELPSGFEPRACRVNKFMNNEWTSLGQGLSYYVNELVALPNGDVLVGGYFRTVGGRTANRIAKWDGANWQTFGQGIGSPTANEYVSAIARLPDSSVVAGGLFQTASGTVVNNIARWDGASWTSLAGGSNGLVSDLLVMPNGDMITGGSFTTIGGVSATAIARWNGSAWSAMQTQNLLTAASSLIQLQDNSLVVGGTGPAPVNPAGKIIRWNGTAWSTILNGTDSGGSIKCLAVLPDGTLVAGGTFSTPGNNIAKWNGTTWSAMGSGLNGSVNELGILADGRLVATGQFALSGTIPVSGIAVWNGTAWSALGTGLVLISNGLPGAGTGLSLATRPDGELIVGGNFNLVNNLSSAYMARYTFGSPGPSIMIQPINTQVCLGESTSLSVFVNGTNLSYQWRKNQVPIELSSNSTATQPTLVLSISQLASLGTFDCVVSSNCGTVTSNSAIVSLDPHCCDSLDFNNDTSLFDPQDIEAFLSVYSEGPCVPSTATCNDIDFNNDTSIFDPCDINSFLVVYSEGPCTPCGV